MENNKNIFNEWLIYFDSGLDMIEFIRYVSLINIEYPNVDLFLYPARSLQQAKNDMNYWIEELKYRISK